ncbi:MAG: UTP--glucose-1-phosphate uridylyltransferase [Urechidicola sp.]|jgi:UTP--glucose-1-phosphate uridylyltransferase
MKSIRTVVIPVAGLGTRLLPASKAIPKEMVTVVDKPVIQHVVEEAVAAGMTKIVLVTRSGKEAIENHFDSHFELETQLQQKGKVTLLNAIHEIIPRNIEMISIRQPRAAGLGDAIRCAEPAVGGEPFAVMLPDVLFSMADDARWNMKTMVDAYSQSGNAQILVEKVPETLVDQYGIVDCGVRTLDIGSSAQVCDMVEKPSIDTAPSNLSIVGRYVLPPSIFELLKTTGKGAGGEIQLTDALLKLMAQSNMQALMMRGRSFDCGNKLGFLQANLMLGLQDESIGSELMNILQQTLTDYLNESKVVTRQEVA